MDLPKFKNLSFALQDASHLYYAGVFDEITNIDIDAIKENSEDPCIWIGDQTYTYDELLELNNDPKFSLYTLTEITE